MKKEYICTNCYYKGYPKVPDSFLIEVILWLCYIIPGLIYTCWRRSEKNIICAKCNQKTLVPLNTPRGKELLEKSDQNKK